VTKKVETKPAKQARSYDEKTKFRVVEEITAGLLSHRVAAKKSVINRKTVDSWITSQSYNNYRPMELATNAMIDIKEDTK